MLLSEIISKNPDAPVVVLFGGNPMRRDEVIQSLKTIGDITIYGTLSEEEGMEKIKTLPKVDLVLIGGRYTDEQRIRIRKYVSQQMPNTKLTEPGYDYPYENVAIMKNVMEKLRSR
jgi:hypothetical protein